MLSRHTKRAIIGLVFIVAALVLIGAASRHYFAARALEIRLEQELAQLVPAEPLLLKVERSDRSRLRSYAVRLQPYQRSSIAAETPGRVEEVLVETGDFVEEGQPLIRLDATIARMNVEAARAALEAGEAQLMEFRRRAEETERLVATNTVPPTRLEAARAEVSIQEKELARLHVETRRQEELLDRHEIRAPFAGNINQRVVERGDSVSVNQPVATLVTLDPLRIRFFVSDLEVGSFKYGQDLRLTLPSFPGKEFSAPVSSVARATDPENGLFMIEALAPNPGLTLLGGATGRAITEIAQYRQTLFVPAAAVRFDGRRALVDVWTGESSETREVELGREIEGYYPVFAGIEEGELVVAR